MRANYSNVCTFFSSRMSYPMQYKMERAGSESTAKERQKQKENKRKENKKKNNSLKRKVDGA